MKGCFFVTMKDCLYGFTLAGFQQVEADGTNVLDVLAEIVNKSDPGLVFIDERLMDELVLGRIQLLEKQWGGAVISLPAAGKTETPAAKDSGRRFIARVLGYQMKLS